MVAIVVALAAVIGGVAAAVKPTKASASSVRLEPTSFAGASPFVSPVGTDQAGVVAPAKTGGEFSGATAGLYSRNPEAPSCDGQTLVAALQADDQKATAWASALSIQAADIPGFVSKLTPVVLRSDTSVTVFGYDAGTYFPYPAVLQAGTAVFINSYGEPTVKCYSGNPLASRAVPSGGTTVAASYVGPSWGSFSSSSVTVVRPSTIVNQTFCTGGNATGGTTTGGTTTGGAPGSTTTGGNTTGGTTIGGAGCVITGGGAGPIVDCKKSPQTQGCQPPPPPVTPPTDPTCQKGTKDCPPTTPPCNGDPKALCLPGTDGVPAKCKGVVGPGDDPDCAVKTEPVPPVKPTNCVTDPTGPLCQPDKDGVPTICKGIVASDDPVCNGGVKPEVTKPEVGTKPEGGELPVQPGGEQPPTHPSKKGQNKHNQQQPAPVTKQEPVAVQPQGSATQEGTTEN
jgi:hypothetical protein